jgi:hypothetical protein
VRAVVWLWGLCACNQVFGLGDTDPAPIPDAQYFDAPIDAPFTCPEIGTLPVFSRVLHQLIQSCSGYSIAATGRAVAYCSEPKTQVAEGAVDDTLVPVAGLEQSPPSLRIDYARYAPEGDELIVRFVTQAATNTGRIVVFTRTGTGFVEAHDIKLPGQMTDSLVGFGAPSRGPKRRMLVYNVTNAYQEIEFDASGTATLIGTYNAAELGVQAFTSIPPNLSPDGLRGVFSGVVNAGSVVLYLDRANISQRFGMGRVLDVPYTVAPFMTEDCARVYLSGLGSMFWVQQQ